MPPKQTCECLTHAVHAKCENGCVFSKTKPQSIITTTLQKVRNRPRLLVATA